MRRRTKIVATLGPAVASAEAVQGLVDAGMDVARINCSHGDWDARREFVRWVRETDTGAAPVGVLIDLQGPKFRLGEVPGGARELATGEEATLGPEGELPVPPGPVWDAMVRPRRVLVGDGDVQFRMLDSSGGSRRAVTIAGGRVSSRQGLTVANVSFDVPPLTPKDVEDAREAVKYEADFLALSYVRRGSDIEALRALVAPLDPLVRIVAKVETRDALRNIDEIVAAADAVMVARGDLGLQMEIQQVPPAQKRIIRACNEAGKPVITATQMLESMIRAARPTRAEASDVANAILDGSDAVMLSGETATGAYPHEAVRTMAKIAVEAERTVMPAPRPARIRPQRAAADPTQAVALAAVTLAESVGASAILAMSASGHTPAQLARFRPSVPVFAAAWSPRTQRQLSLTWGVKSVMMPATQNTDEAVSFLVETFVKRRWLARGQRVVVTSGYPPGSPGRTNLLLVRDA